MIDFHSHILPGIDDGSASLEETMEMLRMEQEQGVTKILATPHFYAEQVSVSQFLDRREQALAKVRSEIERKKEIVPEIQVGAEVYYFPGIGRAEMLPDLCFKGTSILLLELPFSQWTDEVYCEVEKIITEQELTVILAHVERYIGFQKKKDTWNKIMELPLYAQINAGSLMNRKKKKFDLKFIASGFPVVLGSDCHNVELRPPNLQQGREILADKLGSEVLETIDVLGRRIMGEDE